ncbi:hypothetical protein NQ837_003285 [Providencia rettgeri]|uniref:hypothetical protein n=1 Tax=Providencia TaxID=586 RepID=UPI00234AA6F1|nr:hypothetical protein [Providencia sp. PROV158]EJD6583249.1 hypothetical protein [Providencia rettgeri]ELR5178586.1 hypothetical protein [Providencia rettgeri]
MEFKGTKGKFNAHTEVANWYSFENRFFEVTDENNQIVAFVKDWNGAGEQPKHDTRLLAAAPELLSELIRLRNIVASYKQDSGDNLDITDAVIAKALGQQ